VISLRSAQAAKTRKKTQVTTVKRRRSPKTTVRSLLGSGRTLRTFAASTVIKKDTLEGTARKSK